ncbi:MAG: PAS domain-containing protein [Tateyamaria sp.]|nr:PAS domain-containing protein [Tateyamaria sp.]MBT6267960.1 PAS domain-containing protein [Tateyamaria sp.]MBT6341881.1 PAS domain-containing protein [Tateyamaria sp.]MBT7447643.1 PAS domain-containing protein [Tateyamaria sp.]MBT7800712.1 PAS domain-containing protein [Tateyamaria sp.]
MVVSDPRLEDNPIIYVNHAFTKQTGYARSAAVGRNCRFLQGEETSKATVDKLRASIQAQESVSVDILNYRASGEPFMNRLLVAPLSDENGELRYYVGIQKELNANQRGTDAERMNQQLSEVQDRVEADMSMIIGMVRHQSNLSMQPAEYAALTRRIETLQLLYEEMALSDRHSNEDSIHMGSYISRLACAIGHVYGRSGIRLNLQVEPLNASMEIASRVGLVTSELLSNSFEHAFDRIETGLVEVRMSQLSGGGLRLTVSDDGLGIPNSMQWPSTATMGGRMVAGLIEGLEGTMQLGRGAAGSYVTIDVPAGATLLK